MTLDDFTALLDRCGGDPSNWPPGAERGAQRLLGSSAEARAELAAMQRVEGVLRETRTARPPEGFAQGALQRAQVRADSPSLLAPVGWAAAAILALSIGATTGAWRAHLDDPAAAVASALSTPGDGADAG